jgi:hypothetical protein
VKDILHVFIEEKSSKKSSFLEPMHEKNRIPMGLKDN